MLLDDPKSVLSRLATSYREAAGTAFAAGADEEAERLRAASRKIDTLAGELPALPVSRTNTRG